MQAAKPTKARWAEDARKLTPPGVDLCLVIHFLDNGRENIEEDYHPTIFRAGAEQSIRQTIRIGAMLLLFV
jgi:hypothetical protein